jgi:sugar lactone lactonase YvrE
LGAPQTLKAYGYGICNRETGEYRWIKKVWSEEEVKGNKPERMRGNDGAVDSQGRFWVGFMNDPLVAEVKDEGPSTTPLYNHFSRSFSIWPQFS